MNMKPSGSDDHKTEDSPINLNACSEKQKDQIIVELSSLCFGSDLDLVPYWQFGLSEANKLTLDNLRHVSVKTNKTVSQLAVPRTGRDFQRYAQVIYPDNNVHRKGTARARLTTGAIPILNDGRILLVSSRKTGWVLPKGGWENDESLEEGAIREVFEEAGVIGLLGPPFPSITHETKKTRKRRLAFETSSHTESSFSDTPLRDTEQSPGELAPMSRSEDRKGVNSRLQPKASDIQQHSHNQMAIFPLYVQHVFGEWPESDRSRRAFSIEQAEGFLAQRPEYLAVLTAVKENNLHCVCSRSTKVNS